jgi:DNA-binding PadR family transcriptional regulator
MPSERGRVVTSRYLILAALSRGEAHGYSIHRRVEAFPGVGRKVESSRVYALLRQLESSGLVTAREVMHGGATRRVYRISARGCRALDAWLARPVRANAVTRRPLVLHLAVRGTLDAAQRASLYSAAQLLRRRAARLGVESEPLAGFARALAARRGRLLAVEAEALERWLAAAPAPPIRSPRSAPALR